MNLPKRFYTIAWLFLALFSAGLEASALLDKDPGDTLSEHIWWLFDTHAIIWWMGLGAVLWAIRHLWWKKR